MNDWRRVDRLLNAETLKNHQEVHRLSGGDGAVMDQLAASLQTLQRIALG